MQRRSLALADRTSARCSSAATKAVDYDVLGFGKAPIWGNATHVAIVRHEPLTSSAAGGQRQLAIAILSSISAANSPRIDRPRSSLMHVLSHLHRQTRSSLRLVRHAIAACLALQHCPAPDGSWFISSHRGRAARSGNWDRRSSSDHLHLPGGGNPVLPRTPNLCLQTDRSANEVLGPDRCAMPVEKSRICSCQPSIQQLPRHRLARRPMTSSKGDDAIIGV